MKFSQEESTLFFQTMEVPYKQTTATKVPSVTLGTVVEVPTTNALRKGYVQIPEEPTVGKYACTAGEKARPSVYFRSNGGRSFETACRDRLRTGIIVRVSTLTEMGSAKYQQVQGLYSRATTLSSPDY